MQSTNPIATNPKNWERFLMTMVPYLMAEKGVEPPANAPSNTVLAPQPLADMPTSEAGVSPFTQYAGNGSNPQVTKRYTDSVLQQQQQQQALAALTQSGLGGPPMGVMPGSGQSAKGAGGASAMQLAAIDARRKNYVPGQPPGLETAPEVSMIPEPVVPGAAVVEEPLVPQGDGSGTQSGAAPIPQTAEAEAAGVNPFAYLSMLAPPKLDVPNAPSVLAPRPVQSNLMQLALGSATPQGPRQDLGVLRLLQMLGR